MGKIGEAGMERPSSNLRPLSNLCSTDPFEFARTSADLSWTGEKKLWRDGILLLLKLTKGFWVHRFDQIAQEGLDCGVGHCHLPEVGVGDPQRKSAGGRQSFIL